MTPTSDTTTAGISMEELRLATRNHGMPLEALRYPTTPVGLHYVLVHYDIPAVDPDSWRLTVDGRVARPLELSLSELRAMPVTTRVLTMECAGNGRALLDPRPSSQPWVTEAVGTAEWTGVALDHVLAATGVGTDAVEVLFTGADRGVEAGVEQSFQRSLGMADAMSSGALLAYDLGGAPLPPQHGFPVRLVVPGWYGMTNVKWLSAITVLDEPFTGYQQAVAYRVRHNDDEPGEPLQRMAPRALMIPPGIPEFFSRARVVPAGGCDVRGRAWSGMGTIVGVEVSTDGGATWHDAVLDPADPAGPAGRSDGEPEAMSAMSAGWRGWTFRWDATPGDHVLCCRATDSSGRTQPTEPPWNLGGYANNAVQRVVVQVAEPDPH
jgi:sulfane dehydrogenase subunit SoxC